MDQNTTPPHGWVAWRDYVDLRFAEFQRAVDKAEKTMGDRLAGMNEFRDTLKDQAGRFVTSSDIKPIQEDIRGLRKLADIAEGKASQTSMLIAQISSLIGIALGLVSLFGK